MTNTFALSAPFLLFLAAVSAQDLKVGDPAPSLSVAKWVKGDPVEKFAADKIYVVEFWATWCGPCIQSMPHLSHLQSTHGKDGLTIVGVTSQDPNNSLAAVETMVKDKGAGMGYTVAWDDGRKTSDAYLRAAKRNGIPCSFVVDKAGKVAYIGHPMWLDIPLAGVMAGNWDPIKGKDQIAATEKRVSEVMRGLNEAPEKNEPAAEALIKQHPFLADMIEGAEFNGWLTAKNHDKAYALGGRLVDAAIAAKDEAKLNEIAWTIVDPEGKVEKRDLELAQRAAEKAVEITKSKDANVLDTLARVHFWKKDVKKAIELQTQAVAIDGRADIKKSLTEYRKALEAGGEKKAEEASGKK